MIPYKVIYLLHGIGELAYAVEDCPGAFPYLVDFHLGRHFSASVDASEEVAVRAFVRWIFRYSAGADVMCKKRPFEIVLGGSQLKLVPELVYIFPSLGDIGAVLGGVFSHKAHRPKCFLLYYLHVKALSASYGDGYLYWEECSRTLSAFPDIGRRCFVESREGLGEAGRIVVAVLQRDVRYLSVGRHEVARRLIEPSVTDILGDGMLGHYLEALLQIRRRYRQMRSELVCSLHFKKVVFYILQSVLYRCEPFHGHIII